MRAAIILLVTASIAATSLLAEDDKKKTPEQRVEVKATEEDAKAITAAIDHFIEQKEIWVAFNRREAKKVIVVHADTCRAPGLISDGQLNSDLDKREWKLPAELRESLRQRNEKVVSLKDLKFGKTVRFAEFKKGQPEINDKGEFKDFPDAKALADVWLPGYSKDGSTAVVRFSFAPTAHGATATYLLTKKDGIWKVSNWAVSYYM